MAKRCGHWMGALILLLAGTAAAVADGPQIARVERIGGEVMVERGPAHLPLKSGDPLYEGDVVTTGASGSVGITFTDSTTFSTGPNSELSLRQFQFNPANSTGAMLAEMKHGTLSVVSGGLVKGSPGGMKIKTPTAVLNVRGTTFLVKVD